MGAGRSFYRAESCFSRDLAVLSGVVHRRQRQQPPPGPQAPQAPTHDTAPGAAAPLPPLHVADLMAGSGIRSLRYLLQAGADHGEPPSRRAGCQLCVGLPGCQATCVLTGLLAILRSASTCAMEPHAHPAGSTPCAVLCNEGDLANAPCLEANLAAAAAARAAEAGSHAENYPVPGGGRQWRLHGAAGPGGAEAPPLCELAHEDAVR